MAALPRSPLTRDVLLGVAVTAAAQAELLLIAADGAGPSVWHHLEHVLILPALGLRRRAPLGSILVAAVGLLAAPLVGPVAVAVPYLALLFLLASLGWFASLRRGLVGVAATLACGLGYDAVSGAEPVADLVVNAVLIGSAWMAGHGLRVATDRRVAVEVATDRAARDAVAAERGRIARDLHDSLAHALTLITLRAGGARERVVQASAAQAFGAIEQVGREALADMHRALGLLGPATDDAPGMAHLPDLVEGFRGGGLTVDLDVQACAIPGSVSTTIYRVVQEALTNVTRHSNACTARVRICHKDGELVTVVTDPGPARPSPTAGTGRGLDGLRQRLDLFGGSLASHRHADGWRVEARIPLAGVEA
ncbi:sensor histidine kinase [Pseudactinotalea sp. Z1748]|uniref:sensor histidine kinase n=1 Tax=Pseudactinotalea sp. Z1748 TaxID=3413027 RepID=UPI003C7DF9B7